MKGLVSCVCGHGDTPASAATPSSPGASAPAPAKAEPAATPEHQRRQLEVRQAMRPPPGEKVFSILTAALDATERAGPAVRSRFPK